MKTEKVGQRIRTITTQQDLSLDTLALQTGFESGFFAASIEVELLPGPEAG